MRRILWLGCFLSSLPAAAAEGWTQLRPGLTRPEAALLLGMPLIASQARGFDVALYDRRGELLFVDGRLVAWTAPTATPAAGVPEGTWGFVQHPTVRPKPPVRLPQIDTGETRATYRYRR
jgi:hypothetical protein